MSDRRLQEFLKGCNVPPTVKPIDRCERGQYETGKPSFDTTDQPLFDWEDGYIANDTGVGGNQLILPMPGSLMFLQATFSTAVVAPAYILLFDVDARFLQDNNGLQGGMRARYTFGPCVPIVSSGDPAVSSGGTVTYEATAEEVYNAPDAPGRKARSIGLPFNFGIAAVASFAPRLFTRTELGVMEFALTARFQT